MILGVLKFSRCINFCGIYIVICNSHLDFSKSTKIYHLENLYAYSSKNNTVYHADIAYIH